MIAISKAGEAIRKPIECQVNVLPIYGSLIHQVAYEGPCRFGGAEELTKEFDERATAMGFKAFQDRMDALWADDKDVNLLPAKGVYCTDEFYFTVEQFDELDAAVAECDVIFIFGNPMPRLVREMGQRYTKPMIILTNSGAITLSELSELINRGRKDAFGAIDWKEADLIIHCFKAVKALANTRILKMIRHESDCYLTDDFKCGENAFGVMQTSINLHEVMDQLTNGDGTGNHTLPLRTACNLNDEDEAEAERITDELIAGADEVWMDRDKIIKAVRFTVLARKLMDHFQCNAFTAQCKECCATTRINEEQVTFCLNHSLNNEAKICSACEGDVNAAVAITIMASLSGCAPYQGNNTPVVMEDGQIVSKNWFSEQPCTKEFDNQLYCLWHAVPNRYMDGYDGDENPYAVGPFAAGGRFGATIRRDFTKDAGKVATIMRLNPTATKMLIIKGDVVGGTGYERFGCPEGIYYKVQDRDGLFRAQLEFGCHCVAVFGDYTEELEKLAEILGVEAVLFD